MLVFCSSDDREQKFAASGTRIRIEKVSAFVARRSPGHAADPSSPGTTGDHQRNDRRRGNGKLDGPRGTAIDKVFLYYAPKILAGTGSIPFAAGAGFHHVNEAAQVKMPISTVSATTSP